LKARDGELWVDQAKIYAQLGERIVLLTRWTAHGKFATGLVDLKIDP
jgi:hypothetical protein